MSRSDYDDTDLDTFCRIEEAIREEESAQRAAFIKASLADEFPDSFILPDSKAVNGQYISMNDQENFHKAFVELQQRSDYIKKKEIQLAKDEEYIKTERKELARIRKEIETDKMLIREKLDNTELLELREKYKALKAQYNREKNDWNRQIKELTDKLNHVTGKERPKVKFAINSEHEKEVYEDNGIIENHQRPSSFDTNSKKIDYEHDDIVSGKHVNNSSNEGCRNGSPDVGSKSMTKKNKGATIPSETKNEGRNQRLDLATQDNSSLSLNNSHTGKSKNSPSKKSVNHIVIHPSYSLDFDYNPGVIIKNEIKSNGRRCVRFKDGSQGTIYKNGTKKFKKKDAMYICYSNGDIGIEYPDGAVAYRYKETMAIELSLPDKSVIFVFEDGQKEKHYPSGDKAIQFTNGQYKVLHPNGDYEIYHTNGKVEKCVDGKTVVTYE